MAALSDLATVVHILKRAHAFCESCRSAPEEIYLAREHVHAMTLCLEGVSSDLYENQRSFVHQTTYKAKTRQHTLKAHIASCDRSLMRMEVLLQSYQGFKKEHVSLWDKFRWSTGGKKEIAECKADLVLSTAVLDVFLGREQLSVLYKLESIMEAFMKRVAPLEAFDVPMSANDGRGRQRSGSNVTRTIVISLVLARLKKVLQSYRRKTANAKSKKAGHQTSPGRPKPVMRTNSGFMNNPNRNALMHTYASNMASAAAFKAPHIQRKPHPRTPSPDFHYIPSTRPSSPLPGLIRRSSSMQRLTSHLNARNSNLRTSKEHYECWRVGIGTLALGPKTAPQYLPHKRGQLQLRKMGDVFKEAELYDSRAVTESDEKVKSLLKEKNRKVKKGRKWYFVAGKVVGRDPGRTGVVSVEKAFVVLVRR
ncbi:uncharacterized protein N0V89_001274 [Didymosphaeria variabile]|uniref:Uncharacterized protein n=1 Tax=Didymosphaeria variabile TaxID=1932322 RepID=A0A9W9CGJ7_9PLEO|nr:uncharacterized protein N0V89_001274 [Didymosphaeria variabile]KAJ4360707.1 hypothetical protein N0V89_001274 [Didymosphaeria variabile]